MGFAVLLIQSNKRFEREVANTNLLVHYCIAAVLVSISQLTKSGDYFKESEGRS